MKKHLLTLFIAFTAFAVRGQNLVLNGDLEQYSQCPFSLGQIDFALNWTQPHGATSEYYNQCAGSSCTACVPVNTSGYQYPKSGAGYAGIYVWNFPDYREYIEGMFSSPLVAGTCYHFEMYFNLGNNYRHTTSHIGVYFSDTLITGITGYAPLPYTPQITNTPGNTPDTINWTLVSGNYIAQGGENYFIIGNYDYDSVTVATVYNTNGTGGSYVVIDDISLTPCTGINETANNQPAFSIYPNPAGEEIVISNQFGVISEKKEINIYDVLGKLCLRTEYWLLNTKLDISALQSGIYLIEINGMRKKFVKL